MNLLSIQKKFVFSKPNLFNILKGKCNLGKTTALLHRLLYLISNFAYENNDNILFIDKKSVKKVNEQFSVVRDENKYEYMSLLNNNVEPQFKTLDNIIGENFDINLIISDEKREEILKNILNENKFKPISKFNSNNIKILLSEIKYVKNNSISNFDEFNNLMGGPLKLRRNSKARKEMYTIYNLYNDKIKSLGLYDYEDMLKELIECKNINRYTHIFIDNAESFSKLELDFIKSLLNNKTYRTLNLTINTDKGENVYSSIVKKGRVYAKKVFGTNKKIFNFKNSINKTNEVNIKQVTENKTIFEESYEFIDLKHRNKVNFKIENEGFVEKFVLENNEVVSKEEMVQVPVFNNIAAGEPILITPEQEDTISLPKTWLKGSNQKFLLKVKGDSMFNANIHNDDLVIIEQVHGANNGDIVAVNINGNATLKTLKIEKDKVILKPENNMYEPIIVSEEDELYILGKAIGLIRN